MRVLVIPDIHLKSWIFDRAESILSAGKADTSVCLMDIPDDWDREFDTQLYAATFDRAIAFAKDHPDALWCYGNHDVSYLWGELESGYSPYAEATVIAKLQELKDTLQDPSKIRIVQRIDNVLFSHGGLCAKYVQYIDRKLLNTDIDTVLSAINNAPENRLWRNDSPLWLRPQYENAEAFQGYLYTQVVGHTPVKNIYKEHGYISTDVFSTYRDGTQIGESAMLIIDSKTGDFEKAEVPGRLWHRIYTAPADDI